MNLPPTTWLLRPAAFGRAGPLPGAEPPSAAPALWAGCGWGSPQNHPRGRRVSDITCTARYVRNELLAQDRTWTAQQLGEAVFEKLGVRVDRSTAARQRRRRSGPGTFPSASLTRKRLKCSGLKRTAAGGSWGGRRRQRRRRSALGGWTARGKSGVRCVPRAWGKSGRRNQT
jgi:hypothetical protein